MKSTILLTDYLRNRKQRVKTWRSLRVMDEDIEGNSSGIRPWSCRIQYLSYLISNESLFNYADDNTLSADAADSFGLQLALESETVKTMDLVQD